MAKEKIADVSAEDRVRIAVLHKLTQDLEGQLAAIIGNYADVKDPRLVPSPNGAKDKSISFQVVSAAEGDQSMRRMCVRYVDPPGVCEPC